MSRRDRSARVSQVAWSELQVFANFSGNEDAPTRGIRPSYVDPAELEQEPTRSPREYAELEEEVCEVPTRVGLRSYVAPCEKRSAAPESVTGFLATVAAEHLANDAQEERRRDSVTTYALIARPSYVASSELTASPSSYEELEDGAYNTCEIEEIPSSEVAIDHDRSYSAALTRQPRISHVAPEEKSAPLDLEALKAYLFDDQPVAEEQHHAAAAPLDARAFDPERSAIAPRRSRPEISARASRPEIAPVPAPPTSRRSMPSCPEMIPGPVPQTSRRSMPSRPEMRPPMISRPEVFAEAPTETAPPMTMPMPPVMAAPATVRHDQAPLLPRIAEMQKVMAMRQQALSMHPELTREHAVSEPPQAQHHQERTFATPVPPSSPSQIPAHFQLAQQQSRESWRESPWSLANSDTNRTYQTPAGFALPIPMRRAAETSSFKLTVTSLAVVLTGLVALTVVVLAVMFVRADNGSGKHAGFDNARSSAGFNVSSLNDVPPPPAAAPSTITIGDPPVVTPPTTPAAVINAPPPVAKPVVDAKPVIAAKPVVDVKVSKPVVDAKPVVAAKPAAAAPAPARAAAASNGKKKSVEEQLEDLREEQLRR